MARRRHEKEEEEEKEVFTIPEFDEKEYINKEMNKSKASIAIVFLGTIFAIISTIVFLTTLSWALGALIGLSGFFFFKFFYPLFKADASALEKKDYIGHGAIYIFTWLAVFILCINMPFADLSSPSISDVHFEGYVDSQHAWLPYNTTGNFSEYRIVATVTDNSGIRLVEIREVSNNTWVSMKKISDTEYSMQLSSPPSHTTYYIRAVDLNGHDTTVSWKMD